MKFKLLIAAVFLLAFIASPMLFAGADLVADSTSGPDWVPATDLTVSEAQCTRWYGFVSTCSIKYEDSSRSKITPELHYFVYGSWAHERAALVRSKRHPTVVSTIQAIRDLRARQTTAAVWIVAWLTLIGWILVATLLRRPASDRREFEMPPEDSARTAARANAAFAGPAPMVPAPHSGAPRSFGRR